MARPLRIQYPGAFYHVTCRGNERQDIFKDDTDRYRFIQILSQSLDSYTVKLHSYVLMSNHFHLLVETPLGNLAELMRKFNITYTGYYNRRHARVGHLYQGRYKSILVERDAYLTVLSRYIHVNPVRIKSKEQAPVTEKIELLNGYPWSSLPGYLNPRKRESFVEYGVVLSAYGPDGAHARKAYREALFADLASGIKILDKVIGQSVIGENAFIEWVTESFLKGEEGREQPSMKSIHSRQAIEVILGSIEAETGKSITTIAREKGVGRQIAMELLYRLGGLKGEEIGRLMGVGYTSVSQERKRLRERLSKDRNLEALVRRIEEKCHE